MKNSLEKHDRNNITSHYYILFERSDRQSFRAMLLEFIIYTIPLNL